MHNFKLISIKLLFKHNCHVPYLTIYAPDWNIADIIIQTRLSNKASEVPWWTQSRHWFERFWIFKQEKPTRKFARVKKNVFWKTNLCFFPFCSKTISIYTRIRSYVLTGHTQSNILSIIACINWQIHSYHCPQMTIRKYSMSGIWGYPQFCHIYIFFMPHILAVYDNLIYFLQWRINNLVPWKKLSLKVNYLNSLPQTQHEPKSATVTNWGYFSCFWCLTLI